MLVLICLSLALERDSLLERVSKSNIAPMLSGSFEAFLGVVESSEVSGCLIMYV